MLTNVPVPLGERSYEILIGPLQESAEQLRKILGERSALLVADSNTIALKNGVPEMPEFVFPAGEGSKTFATAAAVCGKAAQEHCDRSSVFVALGGGVAGDLTGFAAAIYMRGVNVIQIPTSLLAMVDSSVGGKTAVDLPEGKNLAGAFHQPSLVLIDPAMLRTLPMRERIGALAEILKYAVILDGEFFDFLEQNAAALLAPEQDEVLYGKIIARCCAIKADVVAQDETEQGLRALLNYGHTFGHALELLSDFRMSHGEAVSVGMELAGRLAVHLEMWQMEELDRQRRLTAALGLPLRPDFTFDPEAVLSVMARDKKNRNGKWNLVLPVSIGSARVVRDVNPDDCRKMLEQIV